MRNYRSLFSYLDDCSPVMSLEKDISAKFIGDKAYISKKLSAELFNQKVTLITKIKKKMKNCLMDMTIMVSEIWTIKM